MGKHGPIQRRILVVDDEDFVRDTLVMLLKFDGHVVKPARSAEEALALFEQHCFDLVITDFALTGMKGDKLALMLKTLVPAQPVLMITAYAELLQSEARTVGCVDQILSKPFDVEDLRLAIATLVPRDGFFSPRQPRAATSVQDPTSSSPEP